MLVDYEDIVTGEVIEVYFKNNSEVTDTIKSKNGNECVRLFGRPAGFKFVGAGFHCNDYPKGE